MAGLQHIGEILSDMRRKGFNETDKLGFDHLGVKFDPGHGNKTEDDKVECGCVWWECIHCVHNVPKISCMTCTDPFYDITI